LWYQIDEAVPLNRFIKKRRENRLYEALATFLLVGDGAKACPGKVPREQ